MIEEIMTDQNNNKISIFLLWLEIPQDSESDYDVSFTWNVTDVTTTQLKLQLAFTSPIDVSAFERD